MKFWLCQKNNPHKPEKTSTHERAISRVWRFSFLFCHRHSVQNLRIKFYTQKSAKIGFLRSFCRSSPNFATDLLQTCYKRLKRGPPTRFIINMQKWIRFTFSYQKARRYKKKPLTFFQVNGLTFGGAFSTALEPLCRHLVAAFGTLQAKKRRDISAFQPLLMSLLSWYSCRATASTKNLSFSEACG